MKKWIPLFGLSMVLTWMNSNAQIFEPEGLNMPGQYDGFNNPPSVAALNQLALITAGTRRYHTKFSAAASGGDIVGGNYNWLFTSGPSGGEFNNKWAGVNVTMNTLQTYTHNSGSDNNATFTNGNWYTVNWQDQGYVNTQAVIMETSAQPVTISAVSGTFNGNGNAHPITVTISSSKSTEEKVFVRYTTDSWSTSSFLEASCTGTSCTTTIPGGDVMNDANHQLYAFTTTVGTGTLSHANADMYTINLENNGGSNYQMGSAALPVVLESFSGKKRNNEVALSWSTASETNNAYFDVERSADARQWSLLGTVQGAGTTTQPRDYAFMDAQPLPGVNYYRLRQVDFDGSSEYSQVISVAADGFEGAPMTLFPNPAREDITLQLDPDAPTEVVIKLFGLNGQQVRQWRREVSGQRLQLSLDGLAQGTYLLEVRDLQGSLLGQEKVQKN